MTHSCRRSARRDRDVVAIDVRVVGTGARKPTVDPRATTRPLLSAFVALGVASAAPCGC